MQPYQEEYIANLREIAALATRKKTEGRSFEEYLTELTADRIHIEQKVAHNMKLLREQLFPLMDHLPEAEEAELEELQEFAGNLFQVGEELDTGLFCQIHQALLNLARLTKDRNSMIRELYWLGLGRHNRCSKLVGLERSEVDSYTSEMRLCFTEAGAYLKYFDEIEDRQTRDYIVRAHANMALGQFASPGEKINRVKRTLEILQDKYYQEMEPEFPWDRYIFMTHRQMANSISYSKDDVMSAEDIEAVMESAYIVYQTRLQEAEERKVRPPIHSAFTYAAISYYCGLDTLDGLLTKMENLINSTDISDFSAENMYGLISLPAFYCQYLRQYPNRIPKRKEYIESLYQRILDYMEAVPDAPDNESLFLYLRQLANCFVETEDSISYGEFITRILMRFAPDNYIQSYVVAKAAAVFAGIIMKEESGFFDDIVWIREVKEPEEKLRKVVEYAWGCGFFHDVGKINFLNLYVHTGRQWFEEEYVITRLHTVMGDRCLSECPSTRRYAAAALGHHNWYDGSFHGYSDSYKRLECPERQMVDIIALVDWLENVTDAQCLSTGMKLSFYEAVQKAVSMEGRRFSPMLTSRLRDEMVVEQLRCAFEEGGLEACRQLYEEERKNEMNRT